jgi:hypothetical protein
MEFVLVSDMSEVLGAALEDVTQPIAAVPLVEPTASQHTAA